MCFKAVIGAILLIEYTKISAPHRFFPCQVDLLLSGLIFPFCSCLFQPRKALIADDVFNPAGIGLRCLGVNACGDKLLGKETMALVDVFGNLAAHIGQMRK